MCILFFTILNVVSLLKKKKKSVQIKTMHFICKCCYTIKFIYFNQTTDCFSIVYVAVGVPKCEQPATNERYGSKSTVQRSWSLRQLENFVQDSFPDVPLHQTGFTFAKAEKGRRLSKLNITSAADLQTKIGKGKIFIVPNRDIPLPIEVGQFILYDRWIFTT